MRFFIAIEIPTVNLHQFQSIQSSLHTLIPQTKLTITEKIHLTLTFLGEQHLNLKGDLINIIKSAVKNIPPFYITPAYIDGFPNIHSPHLLWIGLKGDVDKILLIREAIQDGLSDLHLVYNERRFIPHITIAKFNNQFSINRDLELSLQKIMKKTYEPIKVDSIKLFESIPEENTHKHSILADVKLS